MPTGTDIPASPTPPRTTFNSPDGHFSFQYPEDYRIYVDEKPSVDGVVIPFPNGVTVVSTGAPNFMLSVQQTTFDERPTLEDFLALDDCVGSPKGFDSVEIGSEEWLLVPDTPCGPFSYSLLFLVDGYDAYRVTVETTGTFEDVRERAMALLSTFSSTGAGWAPATGPEYRVSCFAEAADGECRPVFSVPMNAIGFSSSDEAWAVGDHGSIFHYDGFGWHLAASPTTLDLNGVWFNSPDDGWAVGDRAVILHWDGAAWTIVKAPESAFMEERSYLVVKFLTPDLGWAAGSVGGLGPGGAIASLWDGKTWTDTEVPGQGCWIELISILSESEAIAPCQPGVFWGGLRWDGSSWTEIDDPREEARYRQTFAEVLPEDAYRKLPVQEYNDLEILSADDIWATASVGGPLVHWDGASWRPVQIDRRGGIADVAFGPDGNGFVLTDYGELFRITPVHAG